jgi:UPF0716 protein FxsA
MWFFPLAFLLWPLIEIGGFIAVGKAIGVLPTLAAIVVSGVLGAVLLRVEGVRVLRQTLAALQSGKRPDRALAHAGLTALGGLLLLLPGFFSDIIGLALFLPPVRAVVITLFAWMMGPVVVIETRTQSGRTAVVDLDPGEWHRRETPETPPPALGQTRRKDTPGAPPKDTLGRDGDA